MSKYTVHGTVHRSFCEGNRTYHVSTCEFTPHIYRRNEYIYTPFHHEDGGNKVLRNVGIFFVFRVFVVRLEPHILQLYVYGIPIAAVLAKLATECKRDETRIAAGEM